MATSQQPNGEFTPEEHHRRGLALLEAGHGHEGFEHLSRAYLIDTIWSQSYVGGDRSVDNAMLRLRKKLGSVGEAIETVWGVGYRLAAEG